MRISRQQAMADDRRFEIEKRIEKSNPGDLVGYMGQPAMIVSNAEYENFMGALIEILTGGRKIKVPIGMIEFKRYKNENAF